LSERLLNSAKRSADMMERPMRHHSVATNHGICRICRERVCVLRLEAKAADEMTGGFLKVNPRSLA
jgi:hypothetical protein